MMIPSGANSGAAPATGPNADVPKSTLGRAAHSFQWASYMLMLAFFSMIVMIAAAQICDVNMPNGSCVATRGYQVSVGIVSLVISLLVGLIAYAGRLENVTGQASISAFLFLWWLAAVIVCTFFGDFQLTTRAAGYFGVWISFGISVLAFIAASESFEYGLDKTLQSVRKPLFVLVISSLICMGAAVGPCSPRDVCSGYPAYAVVVAVVSAFLAIVMFLLPMRLERKTMKILAWFLVLWWVFGCSIMILGGPFLIAGNGFFSSIVSLLASLSFASMLNKQA
jgi:hypothetical protein